MCNVWISQPDIQYLADLARHAKISSEAVMQSSLWMSILLAGVTVAAHNLHGSHWPYNNRNRNVK